jgi:hypothetical protein
VTAERDTGSVENSNTDKLLRNIAKWIKLNISSNKEYREFKRRHLAYTLSEEWERRLGIMTPPLEEFQLPPEIEKQNAVIIAFFNLCQSQLMLSQCEYYFRRFPFRGFPVTRDDHARNVCEFYLGCFYIIRSRFKDMLNKLKIACPNNKIHVGKTLGTFDKAFDRELRARNSVHHREPFKDIEIERILLSRVLASGERVKGKGWGRQHLSAYRKFSREWSRRARDSGRTMEKVIDTIAAGILGEASFLQFPESVLADF